MFDEERSKIWRHAGVIWSTDYMYKVDTLSLFWYFCCGLHGWFPVAMAAFGA